jgi:CheY-like chemotaxis protein
VLIVEDDQGIRESVRLLLEDGGYAMLVAPDAQAALPVMRKSPGPLVVLVDHLLPGMRSEDLMHLVAQGGYALKRHAYIETTASPDRLSDDFKALLADLGVPILPKPFDLDLLMTLVAEQA